MTVSPLFQLLIVSTLISSACTDDADDSAIGVANPISAERIEKSKDDRCVIAQRDGKKLALQVFGLSSSCLGQDLLEKLPWRAAAREDDSGRIVVSVEWPRDKTPACGSCVYNFKAELGPHDWPERTEIKFEVRSCPTCGVDDSRSVTLGTGAEERSTQGCGDEQLAAGGP